LAVTGNLRRSIEFDPEPGQVTITADTTRGAGSNADYASAHNEGTTTAGRNHSVTIPKRQFIGKSRTLDKKILRIIEEEAKKILK
jgi:phage gpG-like protein